MNGYVNQNGAYSKELIEKIIDISDVKGYWLNDKCVDTNGLYASYGYQIVIPGALSCGYIHNNRMNQYPYNHRCKVSAICERFLKDKVIKRIKLLIKRIKLLIFY